MGSAALLCWGGGQGQVWKHRLTVGVPAWLKGTLGRGHVGRSAGGRPGLKWTPAPADARQNTAQLFRQHRWPLFQEKRTDSIHTPAQQL